MKAVFIERYGSNEVVQLGERPVPRCGPRDLLVQVRAASINPIDTATHSGKVKQLLPYRLPVTLGSDLSGVVLEVGAAVTRFKPGDEVFARLEKMRIGAFAEQAVVAESSAAKKPVNLSHQEAASIPLVGLTAYQALVDIARLGRGQKVLIQAGSGGVGTFAIQLAHHLGAHVATTASERNFDLLHRLGAHELVNYKTERFEDRLHNMDVVFDTQAGDILERGFRVLKPGGVIVTIAGLPSAAVGREAGMNLVLVRALGWMGRKWSALARKHGVRFEYLFMRPDGVQLETIAQLLETGAVKPVIDRVFSFEKARAALAYSESGRAVGKIIIEVS